MQVDNYHRPNKARTQARARQFRMIRSCGSESPATGLLKTRPFMKRYPLQVRAAQKEDPTDGI